MLTSLTPLTLTFRPYCETIEFPNQRLAHGPPRRSAWNSSRLLGGVPKISTLFFVIGSLDAPADFSDRPALRAPLAGQAPTPRNQFIGDSLHARTTGRLLSGPSASNRFDEPRFPQLTRHANSHQVCACLGAFDASSFAAACDLGRLGPDASRSSTLLVLLGVCFS